MINGIFYIVLASVAYGVMPVFSTLLLQTGMNAQSIVIFRFFFAATGALALLLVTRAPMRVTVPQLLQLVLFGILGYGATALLLTTSYQYLPIGLSTMFHFTYPLFVAVIMVLFFKERLTLGKTLAILSALGGMVMMAELSGNVDIRGVLLAGCSGLTYAVFVVANRKSGFRDLPPLVVVFYTTASLSACFFLRAFLSRQVVFPPTPTAWVYSVGIGWFCSLFALCMLNKAIRTIGATHAAIGNMLEPLTSLMAGAIVFGDRISGRSLAGCFLVLLAVALMALDGPSRRRPPMTGKVKDADP